MKPICLYYTSREHGVRRTCRYKKKKRRKNNTTELSGTQAIYTCPVPYKPPFLRVEKRAGNFPSLPLFFIFLFFFFVTFRQCHRPLIVHGSIE